MLSNIKRFGAAVTLKVGMCIALRRHKLPPESVALFLEWEAKCNAERERKRLERLAKGIKTEEEKMEEGVGKVVKEELLEDTMD
jgi:hypothetical protein